MTAVFIGTRHDYEVRYFNYRFQARTWLLLNGFIFQEGAVFKHAYNGTEAHINSRRNY